MPLGPQCRIRPRPRACHLCVCLARPSSAFRGWPQLAERCTWRWRWVRSWLDKTINQLVKEVERDEDLGEEEPGDPGEEEPGDPGEGELSEDFDVGDTGIEWVGGSVCPLLRPWELRQTCRGGGEGEGAWVRTWWPARRWRAAFLPAYRGFRPAVPPECPAAIWVRGPGPPAADKRVRCAAGAAFVALAETGHVACPFAGGWAARRAGTDAPQVDPAHVAAADLAAAALEGAVEAVLGNGDAGEGDPTLRSVLDAAQGRLRGAGDHAQALLADGLGLLLWGPVQDGDQDLAAERVAGGAVLSCRLPTAPPVIHGAVWVWGAGAGVAVTHVPRQLANAAVAAAQRCDGAPQIVQEGEDDRLLGKCWWLLDKGVPLPVALAVAADQNARGAAITGRRAGGRERAGARGAGGLQGGGYDHVGAAGEGALTPRPQPGYFDNASTSIVLVLRCSSGLQASIGMSLPRQCRALWRCIVRARLWCAEASVEVCTVSTVGNRTALHERTGLLDAIPPALPRSGPRPVTILASNPSRLTRKMTEMMDLASREGVQLAFLAIDEVSRTRDAPNHHETLPSAPIRAHPPLLSSVAVGGLCEPRRRARAPDAGPHARGRRVRPRAARDGGGAEAAFGAHF